MTEREEFEKLKKEIKSTFSEIKGLINTNQFDKIYNYLEDSPAGDGWGCDNRYIKFSWGDIGDMIDRLTALKEQIDKSEVQNEW